MCVCPYVSIHACKQILSEVSGARPSQRAELLAVWSCQMWVQRTEQGFSARVNTCNFLKILFLIACRYAVVGCVHVSAEEGQIALEPEVTGSGEL